MERIAILAALALVLYGVGRFQNYYFNKPDVIARRTAKSNLPGWLNASEMLVFLFCYAAIGYGLLKIVIYLSKNIGNRLHPSGMAILPIIAGAVIPAMLLSNFIFWSIPYTRKIEDENSRGVKGASFKEANIGLIKAALILVPPCILVSAIGIFGS